VTWATSVPILVFVGLSVLDLSPMYATDRHQTSDRQTSDVRCASSLNASALWGWNNNTPASTSRNYQWYRDWSMYRQWWKEFFAETVGMERFYVPAVQLSNEIIAAWGKCRSHDCKVITIFDANVFQYR